MSKHIPVKVLCQDLYHDAKITRNWGDGVYEVEYENQDWGSDTVDQSRVLFLQDVEVWFEGAYYPAKLKKDLGNGSYDIIYDDVHFGQETVQANRIRWTKDPPNFADHDYVQGSGAGADSTQDSGSTSTKNSSVIGQRVKVKHEGRYHSAVIKECHVDEMYLVEFDLEHFGGVVVDSNAIMWNLVGLQVEVLFDEKYYRATVQKELDENIYLVEYLDDYGVESVGLDRIRWISYQNGGDSQNETGCDQQGVIGACVSVWFDKVLYPARIKAVLTDGQYLIEYENPEYGEEEVEAKRVVWPKQQPVEQSFYSNAAPVSSANHERQIIPQYTAEELYSKLLQTQQALISMTKKTQSLEEQISKLSELPRSHLASLSTDVQHRVFNDLSQIIKYKVTCSVCRERPKTQLVFPCQHRTCQTCSKQARSCPVCNNPVTKIIGLFEG